MNVVFAGYRKWSYDILYGLLKKKSTKWRIVASISVPSAEADFERLTKKCFIHDPKHIDSPNFLKKIFSLQPDVLLFYGWSWMIPKELYEKIPCIILHPSPLPKYRGGSPIQHQIIQGEQKSAVTLFQIGDGLDDGPVYAQQSFSLQDSLQKIFHRITLVGIEQTAKMLTKLAAGKINPKEQDEKKATMFKRRKPAESELKLHDFQTKSANELYNFIRSLEDPYPNAYFVCKDGKRIFFKAVTVEK